MSTAAIIAATNATSHGTGLADVGEGLSIGAAVEVTGSSWSLRYFVGIVIPHAITSQICLLSKFMISPGRGLMSPGTCGIAEAMPLYEAEVFIGPHA